MISESDKCFRKVHGYPLTWTCKICGKERPDDKISVETKILTFKAGKKTWKISTMNIKYCNDNPDCLKRAKNYEL